MNAASIVTSRAKEVVPMTWLIDERPFCAEDSGALSQLSCLLISEINRERAA